MTLPRALGPILLALVFAAPLAAAAQSVPPALDAQTHAYFDAVDNNNFQAMGNITSDTFHVITADGKRLSSEAFSEQVAAANFRALPPMGTNVKIKASNVTPTRATETVDTIHWYNGAPSIDPMSAPQTAHVFATHQLTWIRSANGKWLLDEDHITWSQSD